MPDTPPTSDSTGQQDHISNSAARRPLRDPAYWASLSRAELARTIKSARATVAEHQGLLDDAQGFLDNIVELYDRKKARRRV